MTIRAISKQLGLVGSEVLVFEYLASLYYYGQVWKGTMEKLGEWLGKQELSPLMDSHRVEISLRAAA